MSNFKGSSGQAGSVAAQGREEASSFTDKVKDTAAGAWHKAEDLASDAAGKVKDVAKSVAHGAEAAYEATKDKAVELTDSLAGLIRRNPLPAIMVGLGIGFLVGSLLSRR